MATKKETESKEMTVAQRHEVSVMERFDDDTLRSVKSFEDAIALAREAYGNVESVADMELGNGFKLLKDDDRERLIGVSFVILHYTFNEGDYDDEFVSMNLVTLHNDRFIVNGGREIVKQLKVPAAEGRYGGILVPHGLRKSEYDTCPKCGKPRKASANPCPLCDDEQTKRATGRTFYLDVSE